MPWSARHYAISMKNLAPRVRHKAIQIANALFREGTPEGRAIRFGIWSARRWGAAHAARVAGARRQRGPAAP
jgi:uncharacterized protein YdaT